MKENAAFDKSKKFALRIVRLYSYLVDKKKDFVLSKQILRSGTSIGANLSEAICAISKKDFLSKVYVALKESNETQYWLDLLKEAGFITLRQYTDLYKDCNEITKILNATTKTLGGRSSKNLNSEL